MTESSNDITHPIPFTINEILFIDDMLSMTFEPSAIMTLRPLNPRRGISSPMEIIEKIAPAVLFITDTDNNAEEVHVSLSTSELWLIREIAQSNSIRGGETVGLNLKRKIYSALYGIQYEQDKIAYRLLMEVDLDNRG